METENVKHEWRNESVKVETDIPGLDVTRIAAGGCMYPESVKASPDGKRFLLQRGGEGFAVCDLETMSFAMAHDYCTVTNAAYSPWVHFWHRPETPGGLNTISRVRYDTLESEELVSAEGWPEMSPYGHQPTTSPDGKYMVYPALVPSRSSIVKMNLEDGTWEEIFDWPSNLRHLHFHPDDGKHILVQDNRGTIGPDCKPAKRIGAEGATHFVISSDGSEKMDLPMGEPHTAKCGGHAFWIPGSLKVAAQVDWVHNEDGKFPDRPPDWTTDVRHPDTTMVIAAPGDEKAGFFTSPDQRFYHVSVSKCGRYFCCDSVPIRKGPTEVVVGKFETGKYRVVARGVLCYTGSISPSSRPYLTADMQYVIYRGKIDPAIEKDGGWYTFAVRMSDEFLAGLD